MPGPAEFSVQEILNRVYIASKKQLGEANSGDDAPPHLRSEQEIWNAVFDATNNVLNIS
jgi:hypothetical protein